MAQHEKVRDLSSVKLSDTMPVQLQGFSVDDLVRLERQLHPLLNTVRLLLGKEPVITPEKQKAGVPNRWASPD